MTDEEKLPLNNVLSARQEYWVVSTALWLAFYKMIAIEQMKKNLMSDFEVHFQMRVDYVTVGGLQQRILSIDKYMYRAMCESEGTP